MGSPMNFVDYFNYKINFVKRVTFNTHTGRTSGEGTYLFADDLPVGMATPADCEGIKMEFKYGIAPSSVAGNGKMVHGLDIKMIMDQDWDFDLKPYNATVRGARIQAYSQKDISGRLMGAYINAQAQGTYEIEGYISGATGPGIIGIEARTELATSAQITTPNVVGVLIFHRNKQDADIITGGYRGLQVEVPLMGTGASIAGTTYGIYVGNDWGGTDYFDCGLYIKDSMATTGIQIGDCTTGITLDGTMTTGLNIATGCTTGIQVTATTAIITGANGTDGGDTILYGAASNELMKWDSSAATLDVVCKTVASADFAFSVYATQASLKSDGVAAMFDATISGTPTGHSFAVGTWLNIAASAVLGAYDFRGLDVGVYDAGAAASTSAKIYGICISTYIGSTANPAVHAMMRFNTTQSGGDAPDYWFLAANPVAVAWTTNTTHSQANTAKVGAIKVKITGSTGDPGYIYIYSDAGS